MEAASSGDLTLYGDLNPLFLEKNAGNSLSSPYVATHTPWVSYSTVNQILDKTIKLHLQI